MTPRRTKIAALVAGCAVVAGGGYAAADALSSPAPSSSAGAAALSDAVNGASLSSASTNASGAKSAGHRKRGGALAALRRLPGQYGQYTYHARKGQKVLAFERGTITSVTGKTVTVRAADGHAENWALTSKSAVRSGGKKTTGSALADGKKVLVAGPVSGSVQDARVIIVRDKTASKPAQKSTATTAS